MAELTEKYMGFTIKVYAQPVAEGYIPFAMVVRTMDAQQPQGFHLRLPAKIHATADAAVTAAVDWGRDMVDKLAVKAVPY